MTPEQKMNLYTVSTEDWDWILYVFAETANKAKRVASEEFGEDYIDMRVRTLVKNTDVSIEVAVTDDYHALYEKVKEYGYHYYDEEGNEI